MYNTQVVQLREKARNYLELTNDEYSEFVFEFGIEYSLKIVGLNPDVVKLKSYWDFIENFFLTHNSKYFEFLETLKKPYKREMRKDYYIKSMYDNYIITDNKVEQLHNELKKANKPPRKPRTSKAKNNQLETNLNTI